jgi:hypothetical protein
MVPELTLTGDPGGLNRDQRLVHPLGTRTLGQLLIYAWRNSGTVWSARVPDNPKHHHPCVGYEALHFSRPGTGRRSTSINNVHYF